MISKGGASNVTWVALEVPPQMDEIIRQFLELPLRGLDSPTPVHGSQDAWAIELGIVSEALGVSSHRLVIDTPDQTSKRGSRNGGSKTTV